MSFSDMMSSGRGPGVIGLVMALIVILGFGLLFTFAFDEGMQGADQSIESVIADQAKEIGRDVTRVADGRRVLSQAPARVASAKELARLTRENQTLQQAVAGLKERVEAEKAKTVLVNEAFEVYKDQYRVFARGKAKGESMETLETQSGAVYKNVSIREVTAIGIQIRHDEGQKRIPFEELPEAMKDHFQFDPKQKDKAVAAESATRNEHEAAAAVADDLAEQQMAKQREQDAGLAKEKLTREIAAKEAQVASLKNEIRSFEKEMDRAAAESAAARAAGRMHINKSGSINGKIRAKQNQIAELQSEIAQMRSRS